MHIRRSYKTVKRWQTCIQHMQQDLCRDQVQVHCLMRIKEVHNHLESSFANVLHTKWSASRCTRITCLISSQNMKNSIPLSTTITIRATGYCLVYKLSEDILLIYEAIHSFTHQYIESCELSARKNGGTSMLMKSVCFVCGPF